MIMPGIRGWGQSHPSHRNKQGKQMLFPEAAMLGRQEPVITFSPSSLFSPSLPPLPFSLAPRPGPRLQLIPRLPHTTKDMLRKCQTLSLYWLCPWNSPRPSLISIFHLRNKERTPVDILQPPDNDADSLWLQTRPAEGLRAAQGLAGAMAAVVLALAGSPGAHSS